jgi:hypothetical protein
MSGALGKNNNNNNKINMKKKERQKMALNVFETLTEKKEDGVRALNAKRMGLGHKVQRKEFENKIAQHFMKP